MAATADAGVVSYPLPSFAKASQDFRVTADGVPIPVEHYRDRHVAQFETDGETTLQIKISNAIKACSIHPLSFGLKGATIGDTVTLTVSPIMHLPQPTYLLFKINQLENLIVLVEPKEAEAPTPGSKGVLSITSPPYAADPSGKELATKAIQSAIDDASRGGGGIVYVPAGLYRVQGLSLKDNVTLYLAGGSTIRGSEHLADYEGTDFGSIKNRKALIEARNFKNIALRGRGWIDAGQTELISPDGKSRPDVAQGIGRRRTIYAKDGTNFTIDGIMARDATAWSVLFDRLENARISRLKIIGPMWPWADGIDICGRNIVVEKCLTYTGDDNYCTKAMQPDYTLSNIVFRDSIGYSHSAGVKVGMQARGDQTDIHFENIDIIHAGRGLVVEHRDGKNAPAGKSIRNIFFKDIRVEEVAGTGGISRNPIQIRTDQPAPISNLHFQRITIGNFGPNPSRIAGFDEKNPVSNVTFESLAIGGKAVGSIEAGDFKTQFATGIKFQSSASP